MFEMLLNMAYKILEDEEIYHVKIIICGIIITGETIESPCVEIDVKYDHAMNIMEWKREMECHIDGCEPEYALKCYSCSSERFNEVLNNFTSIKFEKETKISVELNALDIL